MLLLLSQMSGSGLISQKANHPAAAGEPSVNLASSAAPTLTTTKSDATSARKKKQSNADSTPESDEEVKSSDHDDDEKKEKTPVTPTKPKIQFAKNESAVKHTAVKKKKSPSPINTADLGPCKWHCNICMSFHWNHIASLQSLTPRISSLCLFHFRIW
jgi:hypothetical protein